MTREPAEETEPDLDRLFADSVAEILARPDPARFQRWLLEHIGRYLVPPPGAPQDEGFQRMFAVAGARAIWNVMPLPANGWRPRPLQAPGRNDPCPCGSGAKYKRCCRPPNTFDIPAETLWPYLLAHLAPEQVRDAVAAGALRGRTLAEAVVHLAEFGGPKRAVKVLEAVYDSDHPPPAANHGPALDLLFDLYSDLGHGRRKRAVIERILASDAGDALKATAWHRLAMLRRQEGDPAGAWEAVERARRHAPEEPFVGVLEIQFLLEEGRPEEARERARYWVARLRRQRCPDDEPPLAFFLRVLDDPVQTFADIGVHAHDDAGAGLRALVAGLGERPLPGYRLVDPTVIGPAHPEQGLDDALADMARSMGLPEAEVERVLPKLRADLERLSEDGRGAPDEDTTDDEEPADDPGPLLVPPDALAALEREWHEVFPLGKPFSTGDEPFREEDAWDPDHEAAWTAFLEAHPEAFDSLDVLDDLATALMTHAACGDRSFDAVLLAPLLERALAILDQALGGAEAPRLTWLHAQNRPALRCANRLLAVYNAAGRDAEALALAERLLALNPADNHGHRGFVMNACVAAGRDDDALALAARYPDDAAPEIPFGRALVLFRRGRELDAGSALREAMDAFPKVIGYLIPERRRRPKLAPGRVTYGGDDEAWYYREDMRAAWAATPGAIEWLKRARRRPPTRYKG